MVYNNPVFFQWITKIKIHSSLFFSKIPNEKIMVRLMGREIRYMEQSYPLEDNRTQLIKKYATIFRTTYFINVITK